MSDERQQNEVKAREGDAISTRDISASEGSEVNINSITSKHEVPKSHNQQGDNQFNGVAQIFQFLSKYIETRIIDYIFGAATFISALVFGGTFISDFYPVSGSGTFTVSNYLILSISGLIAGFGYLALRQNSLCPVCNEPFALRRNQEEIGRDKIQGKPDDLLIKEETRCTQCQYEDIEKFWKPDPDYNPNR